VNFYVLHTGDSKEHYWTDAFKEYKKRMSPLLLEDICLKPQKLPVDPNPMQIEQALEKEADAIFAALKKHSLDSAQTLKIALCIEGKMLSSEKLAELIEQSRIDGRSQAVFILGSSHGLSPRVKDRCFKLSFSPMTFPHQLAKVMLAEQIYRATSIIKGTKYHK